MNLSDSPNQTCPPLESPSLSNESKQVYNHPNIIAATMNPEVVCRAKDR
jgi:hypothetical protein